jgi:ArsR family transcriptional regulator
MSDIPPLDELDVLHRNICQAVGDPKRIQIIYALHQQPRYVTALAETLDMPQPTISRHLAILKQRGIVVSERNGAAVVYRLADDRIIVVLDKMRQLLHDVLTQQANSIGTI